MKEEIKKQALPSSSLLRKELNLTKGWGTETPPPQSACEHDQQSNKAVPGCAISSLGGGESLHWSVYLSCPAAGERPAVSLRAAFPLDSSQSTRGVCSLSLSSSRSLECRAGAGGLLKAQTLHLLPHPFNSPLVIPCGCEECVRKCLSLQVDKSWFEPVAAICILALWPWGIISPLWALVFCL